MLHLHLLFPLIDEETDAQAGKVACPQSLRTALGSFHHTQGRHRLRGQETVGIWGNYDSAVKGGPPSPG